MMMRAVKMFDYGPRRLQPGDVFQPDNDAEGNVLTQAQLAVVVDDKALSADDERPSKKSKKRYQRADLRAEDDE